MIRVRNACIIANSLPICLHLASDKDAKEEIDVVGELFSRHDNARGSHFVLDRYAEGCKGMVVDVWIPVHCGTGAIA